MKVELQMDLTLLQRAMKAETEAALLRAALDEETKRWEEALRLTWQMVDPFKPAGEPGELDTYCDGHVSVRGSKPTAWVECVKLDGKWWEANEVFSSDFCDQLDAALCALEEFGACA